MPKRRTTTKATRLQLYAAARYLGTGPEEELGLQIPFSVYLQDPQVADDDPMFGFDEVFVRWEPGLSDGPTSARFAVVDYNGDTGQVVPMARWDSKTERFLGPADDILDSDHADLMQFHHVNAWATVQRALDFFEGREGLGRNIPWGFEGNRLIVVPHAGYGQNAFYDRKSKSLQFYYYDDGDGQRVYTCLSADIVNHEFGHAVLDGVRPYFHESTHVETAALHEFVGDLAAVLIVLRNNEFRNKLAETSGADLTSADYLTDIAEQFGTTVRDRPYLRTARNNKTMAKLKDKREPHLLSEVMTGAMFDILVELARSYHEERDRTPSQALWNSIQRMQRMAIQPLDLLPPVDATFNDYARAVIRSEELSNPKDPYGYRDLMLTVFERRGVLTAEEVEELRVPGYLYERLRMSVFHDIDELSSSRAAAYRFLDDNRKDLFIPTDHDVFVADLYDSNKATRAGRRLPRQIVLVYLWRETVTLDGDRYGKFDGQRTTVLCGGTLVFDQNGNVSSWFRKPGTKLQAKNEHAEAEVAAGEKRLEGVLHDIAENVGSGRVGRALESEGGMLGTRMPPVTVREVNGMLRFERTPHLRLSDDEDDDAKGGRRWEISS